MNLSAVMLSKMNRICIFGASGRTGLELVRKSVEAGFDTIAFCRPGSCQGLHQGAHAVYGDLLNPADIDRAVEGSLAVVCAFGPRPPYTDVFCAAVTSLVISSMKSGDVNRLLCITGGMIGDARRSILFAFMTRLFKNRLPSIARDREEQEALVTGSGLAWTIIKPPRLTDGRRTGHVKAGEDIKVGLFSHISRADLAEFMISHIERSDYLNRKVVVRASGLF